MKQQSQSSVTSHVTSTGSDLSEVAGYKSQSAITSAQHEAHDNAQDQHVHGADNSTQRRINLQMQCKWSDLQAAVSACMHAIDLIVCLGCRVSMQCVCIKQARSLSRWRGSPIKMIFDEGYRLLQGRARQADTKWISAKTAYIGFGIACCTTELHHQSPLQDHLWLMQLSK